MVCDCPQPESERHPPAAQQLQYRKPYVGGRGVTGGWGHLGMGEFGYAYMLGNYHVIFTAYGRM